MLSNVGCGRIQACRACSCIIVTAIKQSGPPSPPFFLVHFILQCTWVFVLFPDYQEPALFLQRFVHLPPLVSFMLPDAHFLPMNKPSKPLQNQQWQLKNNCVFLRDVHRVDHRLTSLNGHYSGGCLDLISKQRLLFAEGHQSLGTKLEQMFPVQTLFLTQWSSC